MKKSDISKNIEIPIWEKRMLLIEEAALLYNIGNHKLRAIAKENMETEFCFTLMVGSKILINRKKFEEFLDLITSI